MEMNGQGCGRKWIWANLRYYPCICLEELRKIITSVRISGSQAMIWPWDLLSMKDCYPLDPVLFEHEIGLLPFGPCVI